MIRSKRMRVAENIVHMGEINIIFKILFRKPNGNSPLGRPRHQWEDNNV
jgi:hypothetical protein